MLTQSSNEIKVKNAKQGASVIICCYNSEGKIPLALKHLQQQIVPEDFFWEIIIVNNASTDNTVEIIQNIWKQATPANADCRIIHESRPGQMHARITGAQHAKYECLIFCDDDNLLDENYIIIAHEVIFKKESIGAAGGQNLPVTDAVAYPAWFDEYGHYYAIGIPAKKSGDITGRGFILGAGMVTRCSLFLKMFDERYPSLLKGRNGEQLTTGDDFEYCKRLLLGGYTFHYDERLKLDHFIPKDRLTIDYRNRLLEGIMQSREVLNKYDTVIRLKNKLNRKSKIRLALLTPVRIIFIRLGLSRRSLQDEETMQALIFSSPIKKDAVKTAIIRFAKHL